jgi:hypothetical protein
MKNPDFVGVGFPKCGTSFFYKTLLTHPQIINNLSGKEIHFFSEPFTLLTEQKKQQYRKLFPNVKDKIVGEFSPGTLYYPNSIEKLKSTSPDCKIIVMLRNPIDRSFSHFKHMLKHRVNNIKPKNRELLVKNSIFPECIYSGLYHNGISNLLKSFDKEKVLLIQYERFCLSYHEEMQKVCNFLQIDSFAFKQKIALPQAYKDKEHLREQLALYYQEDVSMLFRDFKNINNFSNFELELWQDFSA